MGFVTAYDVTALFYDQVPRNVQLAGYDTGSGGIAWTAAMWKAHPGAVHIDQDPGALSDVTADVLDVERGAVPVGSGLIARWVHAAQQSFATARRPGQRKPAVYCSASNVTPNVNALIAGGVHSGVGLWVANWNLTEWQAVQDVLAAAGPFPVIGVQFTDAGDFDLDVFSAAWLSEVSGDGWCFGPVRNFRCWGGATVTFGISGASPAVPEPLGVGTYEIAACEGDQFVTPAPGYPVYIPKDVSSPNFSYTGHGLREHVTYTVGVRALATDGHHAGPWVTGRVTPGG